MNSTHFCANRGKIYIIGTGELKNVEGKQWTAKRGTVVHTVELNKDRAWLKQLRDELSGLKGVDGKLDGMWTCRRGKEVFVYNSGNKPVQTELNGEAITIEQHAIGEKR